MVHSATKFFGGHSDVMGGFVCLRDEELSKRIAFFQVRAPRNGTLGVVGVPLVSFSTRALADPQNAEGTGLSPFDAWLFLRGIKTLSLRVEKAQANAMAVAEFLSRHPMVTKLHYAGLRPDAGDAFGQAQYAMHFGQASGAGCVMSFTTGSLALSRRFSAWACPQKMLCRPPDPPPPPACCCSRRAAHLQADGLLRLRAQPVRDAVHDVPRERAPRPA